MYIFFIDQHDDIDHKKYKISIYHKENGIIIALIFNVVSSFCYTNI